MPPICWIITTARATGFTGTTSDSPVLVIVVVDRNISSTQVRWASGLTAAVNEPGATVWIAEYAYAHSQIATVKVAPMPQISSAQTFSSWKRERSSPISVYV